MRALKSAAEPTRLRLLFVLSQAEYTVGELAAVLNQSQPRISRHLRLLTEAGFLDRFREQQCVYYRAPTHGRYLEWQRQLLAMADPDAQLLKRDRERALKVVGNRALVAARQLGAAQTAASGAVADLAGDLGVGAAGAGSSSSSREELSNLLLEELGPAPVGELLDIGTGSGLMLEILGPRARRAVGVDISVPALRLARTRVHGAGLSHCEFRRGDMYSLPYDDACFDTVSIDRVLAAAERPAAAIAEAARTLRPDGRLIVVEDFDQIDARASDNPLSQLRRWFAAAGMNADRLRPCDLAGRHFIVALAHHGHRPSRIINPQQLAGLA
ncbi:MAG TPA: metalloregulator ArsR/SmtB family transcription factor [Steroidobacteraceae bacterium]|nr:metalloregulator ArsR/SmtB family transcription factor [Steroidobacteraceae bacterium]